MSEDVQTKAEASAESPAQAPVPVTPPTPEELATRVRGDLAKWGKIVRASGIKAD